MDDDAGLDSLTFDAEDSASDVYQRAMKEPLSEYRVKSSVGTGLNV